MPPHSGAGPLVGVRVVELAGPAPTPFAGMLLADLGADVLVVDGPARELDRPAEGDPLQRGRHRVRLDLKRPDQLAALLALAARADVLIEGYRPGVAERLGIGPAAMPERLVYARLTGWGQHGPLAGTAGHDLDYAALSGALGAIGPAGAPPAPPLNYLADFGGGGMLCVVGVLAALLERERSGLGQVVDAAMVDGCGLLTAFLHGLRAQGRWPAPRGQNLLDGGAPFYRCYRTLDGGHVAVAAIEPRFYRALLAGLGLAGDAGTPDQHDLPDQHDQAGWPLLHRRFEQVFGTRTRDDWERAFAGTDACVTPVLDPWEAPAHPHSLARAAFLELDGVPQPAPAPRFGRTPPGRPAAPSGIALPVAEALERWNAVTD